MPYTFRFGPVWSHFDEILAGMALTIVISATVIAIGSLVGIFGAMSLRSRSKFAHHTVRAYVEAVRNTPLLAQIFFFYFGLPGLGLKLSGPTAALIALVVNLGAYTTEIVRGGLDVVPHGQMEAAWALGLTRAQTFFLVVLKQALKIMFPALASQFTLIMLSTSIVSQIGVVDLFYVAGHIDSLTYRSFEVYLVVCGIYLCLAVAMRAGFAALYWGLFSEQEPHVVVGVP